MESVCQTLEGALEKAIQSEQDSFEVYRKALRWFRIHMQGRSSKIWLWKNWNTNTFLEKG